MIPGTIARKNSANPREEEAAPCDAVDAKEISARQSAAEPPSPKQHLSRREYFQNLVPAFGDFLVRGLRGLENMKRDIHDSSK